MKWTTLVVPLLGLAVACSGGGHRALPSPTTNTAPNNTAPLPVHGKIVGSLVVTALARSSRVAGTVSIALAATPDAARTYATTRQGTFAIDVAPGNYVVTGHTPSFTGSVNGGPSTEGTCRAAPTAVTINAILHVEVICAGR
jgi:hypothetical protein